MASTRFLIGASLGLQLLALAAVMATGTWGIHHMSRTEDEEFYDGFAIIEASYQLQDVAEQEIIATRGALLGHGPGGGRGWAGADPRLFAAYEQTLARVSAQGEGADAALLAEIRALGEEYERYARRIAALIKAGRRDEAIALHLAEGVDLKNRWMPKLDVLIARRRELVEVAHNEVNATENEIKLAMTCLAFILFPLAAALAWFTARRVITPLAGLEAATRAMGGGRLDARAPGGRDDEFGRLAASFNAMARQVEESVARLRTANEELVRLDRHKDEFLSIVSHELRTPLNAMRGFASLLATGMAGPIDERQRAYAANIVQSAARMERLVNDLLDLASLRLDKLRLDPQPVDVRTLVDDVVTTIGPLAADKGLDLAIDVPELPVAIFDYDAIARVLVNLLGNAVKFTPAGGRIAVTASAEGACLRLAVADTGIGIADADRGKLFQPFSQVDMGAARAAGGTGLGLSISKALVEAHGGRICLESAPGRGSTFWFEVPFDPDA